MFGRLTYVLAIAGVGVTALAVVADRLGILNGVPHPVSLLRIMGFAFIAIGLWFIFVRK
jgi:uncharacterized membrane protein YdcZ (DUF606 family)